LKLKLAVARYGFYDSLHVWITDFSFSTEEPEYFEWVLPRVNLAEKAEIGEQYRWSTRHPCCTVNIDLLMIQNCQHVIYNLCSPQKLLAKVLRPVEFLDGVVLDAVDVVLGVELFHVLEILDVGLEVQDCCNLFLG